MLKSIIFLHLTALDNRVSEMFLGALGDPWIVIYARILFLLTVIRKKLIDNECNKFLCV